MATVGKTTKAPKPTAADLKVAGVQRKGKVTPAANLTDAQKDQMSPVEIRKAKQPAIATVLLSREQAAEAQQEVKVGLTEWANWAGAQGEETRQHRKIALSKRRIGTLPAGSHVAYWETNGGAQIIEQFEGSCTKVLEHGADKPRTVSQDTAVEIIDKPMAVTFSGNGFNGSSVTISTQTPRPTEAKKNRIDIFGSSHTKFFMWAGKHGWTCDEVKKALASLGLPMVSELSIKTFLRAGKSDEVRIREKRGDLPTYTPDQENQLAAAAGKDPIHVTKVIETPKQVSKKDLKRAGK